MRTTLGAEWTSGEDTAERYFDYVAKRAVRD